MCQKKYLFYDHYQFAGVKAFNNQFTNTQAYATNGQLIPAITAGNRTLSFPTGSRTRVLGTNIFLNSTTYYDDEGRAIQQLEDNIKSGVDITTSQYHFDGRVMSVHEQHTAVGTGFQAHSMLSKYLHDKLGRVTEVQQKMGSGNFTSIVSFEYDDRGRLKNKRLAPGYTGSGKNELENLAYSYNIQEQITGINKDYALKTNGLYNKWGNFFGLYLGYDNRDNVFAKAELNGQVTGLLWNTMGDDAQRKYDYGYDNAGRLTSAGFTQKQHTSEAWSNSLLDFSVNGNGGKINYDHNGNILSMLQKGVVPGSAPMNMDDLQYTYAAYSNKLLKVTDNANSGSSNGKLGDFKDGSNGSADDYVYDNNGNLVIDLNKNVVAPGNAAGITYNHLDKPELIRISGKGTLQLVYDADGRKLQRNYTPEGGTAKKIFYAGRYVYEAETLQYISFEEGRIRATQYVSQNNGYESLLVDGNMALPDGRKGTYDYFIRDYQGNVRMIVTTGQHFSSGTATMETARAGVEEPVFGQTGGANEVAQSRFAVNDIPGQAWQHPNIGTRVSRLSKLAQKVGPNSLLKVMAGDEISATTQYFYKAPAGNTNGTSPITEVLQSLLQIINGSGATNAVTKSGASNITSALNGTTPFQNIVAPHAAAVDNTPKAYLTVLFFDERFKFVEEGSTYLRVNSPDNSNANLTLAGIKAPKNGYVYVYVSNESDEPVYFDNMQVAHNRGRIVEESHYYAFGLRIVGISSKKFGDVNEGQLKNQFQWQGDYSEFDDETGWNEFSLRNYDPQIGRFVQADPYDQFPSSYTGMGNDPVNNVDPTGGWTATGLFEGMSPLARMGVTTLGGAIFGGIFDATTGGNGFKGALFGAKVGLASNFLDDINVIFDIFRTSVQVDQRIIRRSLVDLKGNLSDAKIKLSRWGKKERDEFKNHFGADDDQSKSIIKNIVIKEENLLKVYLHKGEYKKKIKRTNLQGAGIFAFVYPNDPNHNVHLESGFWKAKRKGQDSKMGTIAHELSHFNSVGGTTDNAYGVPNARNLTRTPAKALNNADNFEYYIEKVKL